MASRAFEDGTKTTGQSPSIDVGERMEAGGSLTRCARDLHSPDARRREEAALHIWFRFSDRLAVEVRRRLNADVLRRAGVDDVLQSIFANFFAATPGPNGPPRDRTEFWRLLVHFTICKVANVAHYHRAKRRDVRREVALRGMAGDADDSGPRPSEPEDHRVLDPADEAVARMEFTRILDMLPVDLREVFEMRLLGYTNREIGEQIGRVERTVELKMKTIRGLLQPVVEDASNERVDVSTVV